MGFLNKIRAQFSRYKKDVSGQFALIFGLCSTTLILGAGVVVEITELHRYQRKSQNMADVASIAVARYMADNLNAMQSDLDYQKYKAQAEKVGDAALEHYFKDQKFVKTTSTYVITDEFAKVTLNLKSKPIIMDMVGVKDLPIEVSSTASLAHEGTKDVDLVLISDATGSMSNQLMGIQNNMKDFTTDLQNELTKHSITLGKVRVKFIFYRDYMVDNHKDWTGRDMDPIAGMESKGAMWESVFYDLPGEKDEMDAYVDFFQAQGGGSFEESGLEALFHALKAENWGNSATTVRSIVLWTDATPREIGNYDESLALSLTTEPTHYFNNVYWDENIGSHFTFLDYERRKQYMVDNYYPDDGPNSIGQIKDVLNEFHIENSNNKSGVITFNLNIVSGCGGYTTCGQWEEFKGLDGVNVLEDTTAVTETETYDKIVVEVAETILTQVAARDIAIIN